MKLNEVLETRKPNDINKKNLDDVLQLRKSKYVKRTKGKDGKYIYTYKKLKGKPRMTAGDYIDKKTGKVYTGRMAEEKRKEGKPKGEMQQTYEYLKEHPEISERESLKIKYKGSLGRKQLIKDLVKKLNKEMPAISTKEIEAGTVSNWNMIDLLMERNKKGKKRNSKGKV